MLSSLTAVLLACISSNIVHSGMGKLYPFKKENFYFKLRVYLDTAVIIRICC